MHRSPQPSTDPATPPRRRTRRRRTPLGLLALAVALAASAAGAGVAQAGGGGQPSPLTPAQRMVIKEATARFRTPEAAVAAGYLPTDHCVAEPGLGGMGYHYVHPVLVADTNIDPTLPEVLVYHRDHQGQLRLGAVEYLRADADQDLSTDDDRPTLFGHPFDGPMEGHEPGMPRHFDLHVWLYFDNPDGLLAPWNPNVTCP